MGEFLSESLESFFKSLLAAPIKWLIKGIVTITNNMTNGLSGKLSTSPQDYNASLFSVAQSMNESVIIPIAGIILTFVMCYDLIQILIDRNNLADTDHRVIVKWIVKSSLCIMLVSKAWTIVMAFFDLGTWIAQKAAGIITTESKASLDQYTDDDYISAFISALNLGDLTIYFVLLLIFFILLLTIYICTCVIIYFRFMEMIIYASVASLPMSTFGSNEWRPMGNNFLSNIMALALQSLIMMFALGGLSVMSTTLAANGELLQNLITLIIYELTCFVVIKKSGSISKSLFGAR